MSNTQIEILLSNPDERSGIHRWLVGPDQALFPNWKSEIDIIFQCLNEETGHSAIRTSSLSTTSSSASGAPMQNASLSGLSNLSSLQEWEEVPLSTPLKPVDTLPVRLRPPSKRAFLSRSPSFLLCGLSPSGSTAFLLSHKRLLVFSLTTDLAEKESNIVFPHEAPEGSDLLCVALSSSYVVFATKSKLSVYRFAQPTRNPTIFATTAWDGSWRAGCICIHEGPKFTRVAVGGSQQHLDTIKIYCLDPDLAPTHLCELEPLRAQPDPSAGLNTIDFAPDGHCLIAVTKASQILVWTLSDEEAAAPELCRLPPRVYPQVRSS